MPFSLQSHWENNNINFHRWGDAISLAEIFCTCSLNLFTIIWAFAVGIILYMFSFECNTHILSIPLSIFAANDSVQSDCFTIRSKACRLQLSLATSKCATSPHLPTSSSFIVLRLFIFWNSNSPPVANSCNHWHFWSWDISLE